MRRLGQLRLLGLLLCVMLSAGMADAANAAKPLEEVIVVFKTHFDIGYTDLASEVLHRYRTTMIDDALAIMDLGKGLPPERQFAWTVPGWPLQRIMENGDGQTPERQARLVEALKSGRLVVHALPFTMHGVAGTGGRGARPWLCVAAVPGDVS